MTQILPLSIILGSSNTGKIIGYTVLNLDRTEYAAFALTTESDVPGTYYMPGGYSAPDAGGYVVVSESDGGDPQVLTAVAETAVDSSAANVTRVLGTALTESVSGQLAAALSKLLDVASPVLTVASVNQSGDAYGVVTNATYGLDKLARTGADSDTLKTLSDQLDSVLTYAAANEPADIWSYVTRTLTQSSTSTTDSATVGSISRRRGDSWSISLTLGAITGYTSLWFTVKSASSDTDASSIFQIKKNASGSGDGLLYVRGAVATDATKGSITVSDATTGAVVIGLDESITDDMTPAEYVYDCQVLVSGSVSTPDSGTFTITADVTRVIT